MVGWLVSWLVGWLGSFCDDAPPGGAGVDEKEEERWEGGGAKSVQSRSGGRSHLPQGGTVG